MSEAPDSEEWPPICFEGELLPKSLMGISILMDRWFSKSTKDWIWRFHICREVWKGGDADWCIKSAKEITNYLQKRRKKAAAEIEKRLGLDGQTTVDEWIDGLTRIQAISATVDGDCRWISGDPTERAEETRRRIVAFLDNQDSAKT